MDANLCKVGIFQNYFLITKVAWIMKYPCAIKIVTFSLLHHSFYSSLLFGNTCRLCTGSFTSWILTKEGKMFHTKITSPCDLTKFYKRTRISSVPAWVCTIEVRTRWDSDVLGWRSTHHPVPLFYCFSRGWMENCAVTAQDLMQFASFNPKDGILRRTCLVYVYKRLPLC